MSYRSIFTQSYNEFGTGIDSKAEGGKWVFVESRIQIQNCSYVLEKRDYIHTLTTSYPGQISSGLDKNKHNIYYFQVFMLNVFVKSVFPCWS